MSALKTLGAVVVTTGTPTPVYTGPVTAAVSFSIKNGIATIVLGANNLPANGYQPPNAALGQSNGQQVTLWGFTTATYFNGRVVTVIANNPATGAFSFQFSHADVNSTNDAGSTASQVVTKFRAIRVEVDQSVVTTHLIYVGDLNVSSAQYSSALSLAGKSAFVIEGQNIDPSRIFIDGSNTGDKVQVSGVSD